MAKLEIIKLSQLDEQERRLLENSTFISFYLLGSKKLKCNNTIVATSQSQVFVVNNYILLFSYNNIVAYINTKTNTCYDILRLKHDYIEESSQHVTKFINVYCDRIDRVVRYIE